MIPGGWEVQETISAENMSLFAQIQGNLTNAEYTPLAVANQSVGGQNICFICKTLHSSGKEYFSKVLVRIPYSGEPEFQSAKEILL